MVSKKQKKNKKKQMKEKNKIVPYVKAYNGSDINITLEERTRLLVCSLEISDQLRLKHPVRSNDQLVSVDILIDNEYRKQDINVHNAYIHDLLTDKIEDGQKVNPKYKNINIKRYDKCLNKMIS